MKKRVIFLVVLAAILIAAVVGGIFLFSNNPKVQGNVQESSANYAPINVTRDNFPLILEQNSFIKDLPANAVISLKTDTDYYSLRRGSVTNGRAGSYDFEISLPGKYIGMIGDLCSAIKTAKANGDMGWSSNLGTTALMWKYKSMMKYRDCFGF